MQHRRLRNHAPPQAPRRAAPRGLPRGFRILSRISALSGPRYVTAERLHIYAPKTRVRTAHTPAPPTRAGRVRGPGRAGKPPRCRGSSPGAEAETVERTSETSRDNTTLRSVHAVDVHGRRRRRRRGRGLASHRLRALAPLSLRTRVPAHGDQCIVIRRQSIERGLVLVCRYARPRAGPCPGRAFSLSFSV